jgi:hypothetical protein
MLDSSSFQSVWAIGGAAAALRHRLTIAEKCKKQQKDCRQVKSLLTFGCVPPTLKLNSSEFYLQIHTGWLDVCIA